MEDEDKIENRLTKQMWAEWATHFAHIEQEREKAIEYAKKEIMPYLRAGDQIEIKNKTSSQKFILRKE